MLQLKIKKIKIIDLKKNKRTKIEIQPKKQLLVRLCMEFI